MQFFAYLFVMFFMALKIVPADVNEIEGTMKERKVLFERTDKGGWKVSDKNANCETGTFFIGDTDLRIAPPKKEKAADETLDILRYINIPKDTQWDTVTKFSGVKIQEITIVRSQGGAVITMITSMGDKHVLSLKYKGKESEKGKEKLDQVPAKSVQSPLQTKDKGTPANKAM
jgi:hypothetical protein